MRAFFGSFFIWFSFFRCSAQVSSFALHGRSSSVRFSYIVFVFNLLSVLLCLYPWRCCCAVDFCYGRIRVVPTLHRENYIFLLGDLLFSGTGFALCGSCVSRLGIGRELCSVLSGTR